MNIIDAWKKAKEGQRIARVGGEFTTKIGHLNERIRNLFMLEETLLANDWEVVKSPKTIEMTMGELRFHNHPLIPNAAKVTITWEE